MLEKISIETPRFVLRDIEEADRARFLACQADPEFSRFHTAAEVASDHLEEIFDRFLHWKTEQPRLNIQLAIASREQPADYLGTIGIRTQQPDAVTGEVGIELMKTIWGQGAGTEVVRAFLEWARLRLGIRHWTAETASGNRAAERLAELAGMSVYRDGTKRYWNTG